MRGQRHSREGHLETLGERKLFLRLGTMFSGLEFGWTVTGVHQLLGVLDSRARNPHRILELGSRISSVPSWQGGNIWFWEEFGQSSSKNRRILEK
jgi:hypothetical protein